MAEINDALGAKEYLTEMRKKFDTNVIFTIFESKILFNR